MFTVPKHLYKMIQKFFLFLYIYYEYFNPRLSPYSLASEKGGNLYIGNMVQIKKKLSVRQQKSNEYKL